MRSVLFLRAKGGSVGGSFRATSQMARTNPSRSVTAMIASLLIFAAFVEARAIISWTSSCDSCAGPACARRQPQRSARANKILVVRREVESTRARLANTATEANRKMHWILHCGMKCFAPITCAVQNLGAATPLRRRGRVGHVAGVFALV